MNSLSKERRVFLVAKCVLLRMVNLVYTFEPDHAALSPCMVPSIQHFHVGSTAYVPGRDEQLSYPHSPANSVLCL